MTKEFKYRPPIFYFVLGLGGLYVSYVIFRAIGYGGFSLLVSFCALACLGLGIVFTIKFINRISFSNLKIGEDSIEIPARWRKRTVLRFQDIEKINETDSFDNVIELQANGELYLIEGNRMSKNDFREVRAILIGRVG